MTRAALLVVSVWLTLLIGQVWLAAPLGADAAVLASFSLSTALVLGARGGPGAGPWGPALGTLLVGLFAGLSTWPAWIALIAGAGQQLGLAPTTASPTGGSPWLLVSLLLLAPVFEEVLYRERLLGALRAKLGPCAAVLTSSAAFALPHGEPWALLGSFVVGIGLGTTMCLTGRLSLCIGLHIGLNLASVLA